MGRGGGQYVRYLSTCLVSYLIQCMPRLVSLKLCSSQQLQTWQYNFEVFVLSHIMRNQQFAKTKVQISFEVDQCLFFHYRVSTILLISKSEISSLSLSSVVVPSRHLTSVGRQIDVRLRRHNDVGFRLILKVCLTSKTDVILTSKTDVILMSKTDVILTSEKQRWFDVSNVTS